MIYCPKCGTANRDGSRFCNECGEELVIQTHIECPRCGALNPIQNVLCIQCSGRLLPFVPPSPETGAPPPIKGLSLPTKNPAGEQDEELDAAAPEPEDETPAWLRELGASLSAGDGSEEPDSPEDAGEVPDWLRDLRASLPQELEEEAESAEQDEALPDWLTALEPVAGEAMDEGQAAEGEPGDEPLGSEPQEDEIPGWLSRLVPSAAAARGIEPEPATSGKETPGWLARLVPGEAEVETEPTSTAAETEEGEGSERPDEPAPEAPAEIEGDKIPDWLADLGTADGETEAETELPDLEIEEGEIPGRLATLQPADEEAEVEAEPSDLEIAEGEIPGRLATLQPADEEAEVEAEASDLEIEGGEISDWLATLQPVDEETEAETEPPDLEIEGGEIPDWLATLQPVDEETEAETEPLDLEIEGGEIPDWLADIRATGDAADAEAELQDLEVEEGELPDWVAALRPVDAGAESEPAPAAIEPGAEQFPDRIAEFEPPSEDLPPAETLQEAEMEPPGQKRAYKLPDEVEAALGPSVPAWLAELRVQAPEAAAAIFEEVAVDGELPEWLVRSESGPDEALAPAEIPGWLLALKPPELREGIELPAPEVREWSEETGLLAGIPGTLPVEMLIAQPRAIIAAESTDLTMEDSPPARLFSEIVGRSPDATPKKIASPKADVLPQTARWIIYAILIIVVSLPIIMGKPFVSRTIEPTAATVEMHRVIESLDSLDPVLVAFDYDPTGSGEMDPIASALIGHLMDRGAKLVVVSLLPAGPATAQSLLAELAAGRPDYAQGYGERYANLGYLPGQAAAVRLLGLSLETALPRDFYGTPLSELPVMQGLDSTRAFSLIVELAASQDTLRWWIEQAGTPFAIPLGTGASASVIPVARPYYETEARQLVGLVGGVPDAVTYEALVSDQGSATSSSAARLDSQLAGQLLFVLVILAGNVAYFSRRGTRRER
jgi:hypothetical protein